MVTQSFAYIAAHTAAISGTVESYELENGLVQTILVKDSEGNVARVFIDGYITTGEDVADLSDGCEITAIGLSSYDDTWKDTALFPRMRTITSSMRSTGPWRTV